MITEGRSEGENPAVRGGSCEGVILCILMLFYTVFILFSAVLYCFILFYTVLYCFENCFHTVLCCFSAKTGGI